MQGLGLELRKKGFELQSSYISSRPSTNLLSRTAAARSAGAVLGTAFGVSLWEFCLCGQPRKEFVKISRTSGHPVNQSVSPPGLLDTRDMDLWGRANLQCLSPKDPVSTAQSESQEENSIILLKTTDGSHGNSLESQKMGGQPWCQPLLVPALSKALLNVSSGSLGYQGT